MKLRRWTALIGMLVWIATMPARAADPEVKSDFRLAPDASSGLVLFSTWMPEMTGTYSKYTLVKIFYRDADRSKRARTVLFYREMLFKPDVPSDFTEGYGLLRALELPPGDYVFTHWNMVANAGVTFLPKNLGPLSFRVEAGRATYVGSFELEAPRGKNVFGFEMVFDPWLRLVDRSDRDLNALPAKFPGISRDLVDVRIMDPGPWRPGAADTETTQAVPLPAPTS